MYVCIKFSIVFMHQIISFRFWQNISQIIPDGIMMELEKHITKHCYLERKKKMIHQEILECFLLSIYCYYHCYTYISFTLACNTFRKWSNPSSVIQEIQHQTKPDVLPWMIVLLFCLSLETRSTLLNSKIQSSTWNSVPEVSAIPEDEISLLLSLNRPSSPRWLMKNSVSNCGCEKDSTVVLIPGS